MNYRNKRATSSAGFTLIELLVVMIIIGLLAALVGPRMFGKVDRAKQQSAQTQIELFATALGIYRLDLGKYPSTEQGLAVLREAPPNEPRWDGPYLPKEIPLDPWGRPYVYKSPGDHEDYDIISYGQDGQPGGEKNDMDIVSWKGLGQ
ncbi:MAG: type II secretion system major pseudopilin GspG [Deltaproteobacteria bacterium]|nr:type II secretion system major pseudopilin GspG [Deltaproteobacteria bacterium]MBW2307055.1 type II secretion system major pseudopilin GspG [Deltaproteobacteria bacterium]